MINSPIDDLHTSVNDIYEQYDEGEITKVEAVEILKRICHHFLKETSNED